MATLGSDAVSISEEMVNGARRAARQYSRYGKISFYDAYAVALSGLWVERREGKLRDQDVDHGLTCYHRATRYIRRSLRAERHDVMFKRVSVSPIYREFDGEESEIDGLGKSDSLSLLDDFLDLLSLPARRVVCRACNRMGTFEAAIAAEFPSISEVEAALDVSEEVRCCLRQYLCGTLSVPAPPRRKVRALLSYWRACMRSPDWRAARLARSREKIRERRRVAREDRGIDAHHISVVRRKAQAAGVERRRLLRDLGIV